MLGPHGVPTALISWFKCNPRLLLFSVKYTVGKIHDNCNTIVFSKSTNAPVTLLHPFTSSLPLHVRLERKKTASILLKIFDSRLLGFFLFFF